MFTPDKWLLDIVERFEQDPEDEQVDVLVMAFAQEVGGSMRSARESYLAIMHVDYGEVLRYEPIHYLLHFHGLKLKLITFNRKPTLAVEPVLEEADEPYQGIVIRRRIKNEPSNKQEA